MSNSHLLALFFAGSMVFVIFAFFFIYFLLHQRNTQNIFEAEKRRLSNELQQARVKENEWMMSQVAKDIYDNIKENVFAARIFFELSHNSQGREKEKAMEKTLCLLDDICNSAQTVIHTLNYDYIKANELGSIIEDELKALQKHKQMDFKVMTSGEMGHMHPDKKIMIYRIAQDAIKFITQHGTASKIIFYLECSNNKFLMRITDNGLIHIRDKMHAVSDQAMINMEQRCKLLNGELSINSVPTGESAIILAIKDIS